MRHHLDDEGVTRYQLDFQKSKPVSPSVIKEINAWRSLFHSLGCIGQDPRRYRGVGFGNISRRLSRSTFVVSGTQTGLLPVLSPRHYSTVVSSVAEKNFVQAKGPVKPSSESMTHAVLYKLDSSCRVVIHVHSPVLWKNAKRLGLLATPRDVAYGTPEMAEEVKKLFLRKRLRIEKIFSMAGHRDGIVSFGKSAEEAGQRLIQAFIQLGKFK